MPTPCPIQGTSTSPQLLNSTSDTSFPSGLNPARDPTLSELATTPTCGTVPVLDSNAHSTFRKNGQVCMEILISIFVFSTLWWPHRMPEDSWGMFLRYHVVQPALYALWFFLCNKLCRWAYKDEFDKFWTGLESALGMREAGGGA